MLFSPRYIALIISILAINNILIITPFTPLPIYFGMFLLTIILAITSSKHGFDLATLIFVLVCFISIQVNDIPDYFKPLERIAIFVIALLVISPLLQGDYINKFKANCFKFSNKLIFVVIFISFTGKISGIYSGLDFAEHFGGLTLSSMSIAPLAGVSLLISIFQLKYKRLQKKHKWFFGFMVLASILVLILAASRIAIMSAIVAILYLFTRFYRNKYAKIVKVIFVFGIISALTFPLWESYTEALAHKTEQRDEEGNLLSSREELWAFRLEEYYESPIIGIGFSNAMYGSINYETGTVEPGTSWGAVLAMTGTLGVVTFVLIVFKAFLGNQKRNSKTGLSIGHILNALLIFFMFHWIAEGYILAAGSYLFFYSWLIIGVSAVNKYNYKIELL